MNEHFIKGSDSFKYGLVDSGTSYAYLPQDLFDMIRTHFDWYCNADALNNCAGRRVHKENSDHICWEYI